MSASESESFIRGIPSAILAVYNAAVAFVKAYPGGTAGAATAVIAVAASLGLHVTAHELAAIVSVVALVAGVIVHLTTVPKPASRVRASAPVIGPGAPVGAPVPTPVAVEGPIANVPVVVELVEPAPPVHNDIPFSTVES